ncbi:MAG: DinB family protein [Planctomycetaceae bacterium]
MTPQAAIEAAIANCQMVVDLYLSDLTEEETMHRPGAGLNHIRWQLGHLIVSEHKFMEHIAPGSVPTLLDGFANRYRKETATIDDPSQFDSFEELKRLYGNIREATLTALANCSAERLDEPSGIEYAPRVADVFILQGTHWLMHAGQWAVIRRQLGREPMF